jgi:hypothetical protein
MYIDRDHMTFTTTSIGWNEYSPRLHPVWLVVIADREHSMFVPLSVTCLTAKQKYTKHAIIHFV